MTDPAFGGHAIASLLLAAAVFYSFAAEKARAEIISLMTISAIALGLYLVPLPGQAAKDGLVLAFQGFGHPALITICALMVMGRGIAVSGALEPVARLLRRVWMLNQQLGLLVTILLAFTLSMFVNDTPVLVLLLPVLLQLGSQGAMPPSKTLIPINSAVLIGGMATTIGTSTNLLVVSIAQDLGMRPLGIFEFAPLVMIAALIALPWVWLVMPRLLGDNSVAEQGDGNQFVAVLRPRGASPVIGQQLGDFLGKMPAALRLHPQAAPIAAGDRLIARGTSADLREAARILEASLAPHWLVDRIEAEAARAGHDIVLAEVAVTGDSRLIGLTLRTAGFGDVAVVGISPGRAAVTGYDPRVASFADGDILLLMGTEGAIQRRAADDGLLLLAGVEELPRRSKALLSLAIMAMAVGLATLGLVPIAISALAGAIAMFITGCVKFDRVGRALSAQVIVLIAASIALGDLILVSGAANGLASALAVGLQLLPPFAVVAAVMLFVTILTNFASNATAAAVGTPIAFVLAQQLGVPPEPLVLAVLFGCNLCYATPIAYQTNMLIMKEGDYGFADYVRTGAPLVGIMVVTLSALLSWHYGL
jgi:di/tricarboxylate transporter